METINHAVLTFLLNSLWQIPVISFAAFVVVRTLRNGPAAYRHVVCVAALVAALILPLWSLRTPVRAGTQSPLWITPEQLLPGAPASDAAAQTFIRNDPSHASWSLSLGETTATVAAFCYLMFIVLRLFQLGMASFRTAQIRRSSRRETPSALLASVWTRAVRAFNVHNAELRTSDQAAGPLMTGVWRRVIVLPASLWNESSEPVLTSAIGHEMAHVARRDFALNLVYRLLYVPISFHPAAAWLLRSIERTREMACDELVAARLLEARVYARSIMNIAAGVVPVPQQGYTLGVFDGDILEERIKRLMILPAGGMKRSRFVLASGLAALAVCAVVASGLAVTARAQSTVTPELKLAGEAYNNSDFKAAVQHFENAVNSDPSNVNAKLFLANALLREFFVEKGDLSSPLLAQARQQYQNALAMDTHNKTAIAGMISVAMDSKQMADAREWALKLIQVDANDKSGYYTVAVADWAAVFPEFMRVKEAAGVPRQDYFIPDAQLRATLRARFGPMLEEGVTMLKQSLQLDPSDSSAMAYMNLLDRLKAGMADNSGESQTWISDADLWVKRALDARQQHQNTPETEKALNIAGPPPGPAGPDKTSAFPPAPPPPPPPPPKKG